MSSFGSVAVAGEVALISRITLFTTPAPEFSFTYWKVVHSELGPDLNWTFLSQGVRCIVCVRKLSDFLFFKGTLYRSLVIFSPQGKREQQQQQERLLDVNNFREPGWGGMRL